MAYVGYSGVANQAPTTPGCATRVVADANNGYGSLPLGGITLTVPALDSLAATPRLLSARAALSTSGALEVRNPTRN